MDVRKLAEIALVQVLFVLLALCDVKGGNVEKEYVFLRPVVPLVAQLLRVGDAAIYKNAAEVLSNLIRHDADNVMIEVVVDPKWGIVERLVELFAFADPMDREYGVNAVLDVLTHICSGTEAQTDRVLAQDKFLPSLRAHLQARSNFVKTKAFYILSNILVGPREQRLAILGLGVLEPLMTAIVGSSNKVRNEAAMAYVNVVDPFPLGAHHFSKEQGGEIWPGAQGESGHCEASAV